MHLGAAQAPPATGLGETAGEVLDRRLLAHSPRSIAVAFSGGGDSLALLLAAAAWADGAGRRLTVLSVDHRLRPESAAWTEACGATARRLGLPFASLAWSGEKPATGLPAAARAARHALLADAAREAGARVILIGHTADDGLEAELMRQAGSTTPSPREWSPSPAWPEGRGLFLLRPLLAVRRSAIRDWLSARGERWIDDPANEDTAYARSRARQALEVAPAFAPTRPAGSAKALALACRADASGGLELARASLRSTGSEALARFLSAACLCAAGTDRPPGREKIERLAARLTGQEAFAASLAGARVQADAARVRFRREPGEAARGGLLPIRLAVGETRVWDGRFEVTASAPVEVRADGRTAQPMGLGADGGAAPIEAKPLAYDRLLAACGAVEREPA